MPIIPVSEITPKNIRGVAPKEYVNMPYRALSKGDKITFDSCVFSVYPARDKETREVLTVKNGENAGKVITNCTIYIGLSDGHYTSVKNDIVESQLSALTGFNPADAEIGYYPFKFPAETVEVIAIDVPMGRGKNKTVVPGIAFQQ